MVEGGERTDGTSVLLDVLIKGLDDAVGVGDLALLDGDIVGRGGEGASKEGWQGQEGEERGLHCR